VLGPFGLLPVVRKGRAISSPRVLFTLALAAGPILRLAGASLQARQADTARRWKRPHSNSARIKLERGL
jgi:hypothetical protein